MWSRFYFSSWSSKTEAVSVRALKFDGTRCHTKMQDEFDFSVFAHATLLLSIRFITFAILTKAKKNINLLVFEN